MVPQAPRVDCGVGADDAPVHVPVIEALAVPGEQVAVEGLLVVGGEGAGVAGERLGKFFRHLPTDSPSCVSLLCTCGTILFVQPKTYVASSSDVGRDKVWLVLFSAL